METLSPLSKHPLNAFQSDSSTIISISTVSIGKPAKGPSGHGVVIHHLTEGTVEGKYHFSGGAVEAAPAREALIALADSLRLIKKVLPDCNGKVSVFTNNKSLVSGVGLARNVWPQNGWKDTCGNPMLSPPTCMGPKKPANGWLIVSAT